MNGLEMDPREVKRSFSSPISLAYDGPALIVDDKIILLTKVGYGFTPIVQIFAPNSMHIVRQRVLEFGGYKPPKNPGDPNRITALELRMGFNEGRNVIYIGSDKYKLTLEDVIENLSYFSMHSQQVIRKREVDRHQDLRSVLDQLIRQ
jgi:hypothetical protein